MGCFVLCFYSTWGVGYWAVVVEERSWQQWACGKALSIFDSVRGQKWGLQFSIKKHRKKAIQPDTLL